MRLEEIKCSGEKLGAHMDHVDFRRHQNPFDDCNGMISESAGQSIANFDENRSRGQKLTTLYLLTHRHRKLVILIPLVRQGDYVMRVKEDYLRHAFLRSNRDRGFEQSRPAPQTEFPEGDQENLPGPRS